QRFPALRRCAARPDRSSGSAQKKSRADPALQANERLASSQLTASFRPLPAENLGTLRAGICTSAPVCGLRPVEASRFDTEKLPKPTRRTSPPFFNSPVMAENTASTAAVASPFESLAASATAET